MPRNGPSWVPWYVIVRRHKIAIGGLPVDLRMEVGERYARHGKGRARAWSGVRLAGVWSTKSVAKSLLKQLEVSAALYFFGIAADDSFRVVA
jgi:hypothetical protein